MVGTRARSWTTNTCDSHAEMFTDCEIASVHPDDDGCLAAELSAASSALPEPLQSTRNNGSDIGMKAIVLRSWGVQVASVAPCLLVAFFQVS